MKGVLLVFGFLVVLVSSVFAENYRYLSNEDMMTWLEQSKEMKVVDIQVKDEFAKKHIAKAIPTYAFPVKTAEQKKMVEAVLPEIKSNNLPVVIVCPRGGGGAKNTYDYLKSQGVDENRLYILTGGMSTWNYTKYTTLK